MKFELLNTNGKARLGKLKFDRGVVNTPAFMPVGTYGTVKAMTVEELRGLGAEIILGNTFHLSITPSTDVIEAHGDLHDFMNWPGPILTDSGGFQVFSLGKMRKITEKGVSFRSPKDGSSIFMGPEESMQVQKDLGSDIVMIFDECTPYPATYETAKESMELSLRWAKRSKVVHDKINTAALFGIVQGGMYPNLRERSRNELIKMDFDGYALGGLSVGEPTELMYEIIVENGPKLPPHKPRYVMGIGKPLDIAYAVREGIDMFDCVIPTRNARNGQLFTTTGIKRIRNAKRRSNF